MSPERWFRDQHHKGFVFFIQSIPEEIRTVFWVADVIGNTEKNDLAGSSTLICCGNVTCVCQSFSDFVLS